MTFEKFLELLIEAAQPYDAKWYEFDKPFHDIVSENIEFVRDMTDDEALYFIQKSIQLKRGILSFDPPLGKPKMGEKS